MWTKAVAVERLARKGRVVFRHQGRQICLFDLGERGIFACNNRCPHEGYPLREGTVDAACVVTCHWHNWKFDLATGDNLYGGDRLRIYPVTVRDGEVWVDLTDPPPQARKAGLLACLHDAFIDHDYERIARELGRLMLAGGDPLEAVVHAIRWCHERLEYGWSHAFAGTADWLRLYDERSTAEDRLICLLEAIGHMADDALRQPVYPYPDAVRPFAEEDFIAAVEAEDEAQAVAGLRGALAAGLRFPDLERVLSRAALRHYNSFGHTLIYVAKAGELIRRLGPAVEEPLLLALVRSMVYATREDRIPQFREYANALERWGRRPGGGAPDAGAYRGLSVFKALTLTADAGAADPQALYGALLGANAWNMLAFAADVYENHVDRPLADNVGWLDFTHGLTFANAVRRQCSRFPGLWPAGLLQMACFCGRNAPYTLAEPPLERWRVDDPERFFATALDTVLDHGRDQYIVSVHWLKTVLAVREECQAGTAGVMNDVLLAALNRLLHSPLHLKHVRRTARQALDFVGRDG
ncbi:MAG: Rieske (2Fe-2S) protein [Pseudomonadota bacterium]|nr:Rieske (2Fe-2S) protein [Pseudomonadota bacterium]